MPSVSSNLGTYQRSFAFNELARKEREEKKKQAALKAVQTKRDNKEYIIHCRTHPSERKDLNFWKVLEDRKWKRRELIGYYITNYRRIFKTEDPMFVELGSKSPKLEMFYYHGTIVENMIKKYKMTMKQFKEFTLFGLKTCKIYARDFDDIQWFYTIFSKPRIYNKYLELKNN